MKRFLALGMSVAVMIGGLASARLAQGQGAASASVATVDGVAISAGQLDARISGRIFALENQKYELKEQALREMAAEILFKKEAERRKITVEKLLQAEIEGRVAPVTEAEKRAQYEAVKAQVANRPEAEVLRDIEQNMKQQRLMGRREAFINELTAKVKVQFKIDPPRMKVETAGGGEKGSRTAPVTIVIFSDFECPYCSRVVPTFKEIEKRYAGKLRIVFRHYPLPFHKSAPKAAEATLCALEQGKFWEMHDKLFANQSNLAVPELKKRAAEIGLNATTFGQCLDSGRQAARIQKDLADGGRYGVGGTPAFFINGRLLTGAQPVERFAAVIDSELGRSSRAAAR